MHTKTDVSVTFDEILKAKEIVDKVAINTRLYECPNLSKLTGNNVFLKTENLQKTGAFKIRGAFNKIANLTEEERKCGVIASSAGNHAQGVALAASEYGIDSTIVMPATAPLAKVKATRGYGAQVVLHGDVYDDAYLKAVEIQKETGATFVHPFNDPHVIAGQGTIGLEILEELENVDVILVPIGGGGLISGIAIAAKTIKPSVKIIGVEAAQAASMYSSRRARKIVTLDSASTIADGIAVKQIGDVTYEIIEKYVDDIVTVEEDEIAQAILYLMEKNKIVAEGAGAVTTAALMNEKIWEKGKNVVAVVSGGNIDINMMSKIVDKALMKEGRRFYFHTMIPDKPGELMKVIQLVSELNANIFSINQTRLKDFVPIGTQEIEVVLETFDEEHMEKIVSELRRHGYTILL
ncbi:threonine dehydratase [Peptoclostridium litorale DSM 5388]|uniref:L-threonine dehydratase catabolic TdcB n=1 Tax=Peptoclostridium litorale DSM 5388 TaxID=1121324 RepID=A0A069RCW4_PEPLI|nr:threonine ammonia-lyase [Peptoclostridium litorale]KDR94085.1 L-threonine dehydratase catabolic TdcB [Peptoclostridium litorale DSM 5388]SIN80663.1 threonine dehydratase [Peptoclostridium litorale DSM 5388]